MRDPVTRAAFEHAVPERLFADANLPADDPGQPQGVSAVKAIAIAAGQGQRIYTLNRSNQAYHASTLTQLQIDEGARAEIANALAAGREVTVHQSTISAYGWTGSGYIILDPETGAGAYKISGGANWGSLYIFLFTFSIIALAIIIPALTLYSGGLALLPAITLLLAIGNALQYVDRIDAAQDFDDFNMASASASLDGVLDIFAAFMSVRVLDDAAAVAAKTELLAFWAAVMISLTSKIPL